MATIKAVTVIENNTTLTAGAGDDVSTGVNLDDGFGAQLHLKLTNGGTGPTLAAQVQIEVSPDDTNWYEFGGPFVGSTVNSAVVSVSVDIPIGIEFVRTVSGTNTGQDVTVRAELSEITSVG